MSGGVDDLVAAFNKRHAGGAVAAVGMEHESFKMGIKGMLQKAAPPDIFSYWAGARLRSLAEAGSLSNLDELWAASGMGGRFSPAVAEACRYGGHIYGVPVTQHYVAFFYNKPLFDRLGIAPPKNWDEFLSVCARIKRSGTTPLALGSRELWPAQFWFDYILLRTAGPQYRQRLMEGSAAYTDGEVRRAFSLWRQLLENGYFNAAPEKSDWAEAADMVHNGQAAMTLMGTWIIGHYTGQLHWEEETGFDFFEFPVIDATQPQTALGPIDVLALSRTGGSPQSLDALAYFSESEPQMVMSRGSGALAPNIQVPESFYTGIKRRLLLAVRKAPSWAFNYDLATPPPVADIGLGSFAAFLRQPSQMEQILTSAQSRAETIFKNKDSMMQ